MKYLQRFLLVLLTILMTSCGSAEELRYGYTLTRVRVRSGPSTNADILDNLLPERCVLIQSDREQGNIHFIGITYRDAAGNLSTGWAAAGADGKIYIDEISASQFTNEYGLPAGELPPDTAGTSGGTYHTDIQSASYSKQTQDSPTKQTVPESQPSAITPTSGQTGNTQADLIRAAQTKLKELGFYAADITGNIGRKTKIAIKEFQNSQGLRESGELDEDTIRLLLSIEDTRASAQSQENFTQVSDETDNSQKPTQSSPERTSIDRTENNQVLMIDSSGDLVYEIQNRLKTLGYYTGSVTGHYGEKTAAAVKLFQKKNGLSQTGNADQTTVSLILYGKTNTDTGETSAEQSESASYIYRKGDQSDVIYEMQSCLRSLKLYSGDITGHFGSKTKDAVLTFQRKNGLTASGDLDVQTVAAIRNAVSSASGSSTDPAANENNQTVSASGIYSLDWFTAKNNGVFPHIGLVRGNYATLRDLGSGKSIRVYIQSAGYHLDVEPATAQDTSVLCAIYNVSNPASITYTRRPALLTTTNGYRIACSIYGTPHGQEVITDNNYNGQFCLHFLNSRTSGSNKVDSGHQTAIQKAISMSGGNATVIRSVSDL